MTSTETIVVGAGISGLATALMLTEAEKSVILLEAHNHAGGRVQSVLDKDGHFLGDLGPTWIWPAFQPTIENWISKLELGTTPQFDHGQSIFDYGPGQSPQIGFMPSQDGNMRLEGGSQAIINALVERLPEGVLYLDSPVESICLSDASPDRNVEVHTSKENTKPFTCQNIIIAIPPRVAAKTINWQPGLPSDLRRDMEATPTWMAPHAKAVALYDHAFWREQGLSGSITSRSGPIVEGHDHSGPEGTPAAIFGFIGWPHHMRSQHRQEMQEEVREQLIRCFGVNNPPPKSIYIQDWATNPLVASPDDLAGPMHHPTHRPDTLRASYFDNRLLFAGAETATISPGLIEGAFDAAERVVNLQLARTHQPDQKHVTMT